MAKKKKSSAPSREMFGSPAPKKKSSTPSRKMFGDYAPKAGKSKKGKKLLPRQSFWETATTPQPDTDFVGGVTALAGAAARDVGDLFSAGPEPEKGDAVRPKRSGNRWWNPNQARPESWWEKQADEREAFHKDKKKTKDARTELAWRYAENADTRKKKKPQIPMGEPEMHTGPTGGATYQGVLGGVPVEQDPGIGGPELLGGQAVPPQKTPGQSEFEQYQQGIKDAHGRYSEALEKLIGVDGTYKRTKGQRIADAFEAAWSPETAYKRIGMRELKHQALIRSMENQATLMRGAIEAAAGVPLSNDATIEQSRAKHQEQMQQDAADAGFIDPVTGLGDIKAQAAYQLHDKKIKMYGVELDNHLKMLNVEHYGDRISEADKETLGNLTGQMQLANGQRSITRQKIKDLQDFDLQLSKGENFSKEENDRQIAQLQADLAQQERDYFEISEDAMRIRKGLEANKRTGTGTRQATDDELWRAADTVGVTQPGAGTGPGAGPGAGRDTELGNEGMRNQTQQLFDQPAGPAETPYEDPWTKAGDIYSGAATEQQQLAQPMEDRAVIKSLFDPNSGYQFPGPPKAATWVVPQSEIDGFYVVAQDAGEEYGVDPELLMAIAQQESSFRKNVVHETVDKPASATRKKAHMMHGQSAGGLMGFMPTTAAEYGVKDLFDPPQVFAAAAKKLAHLIEIFDGNEDKAIMAYYGDPKGGLAGKNYLLGIRTKMKEKSWLTQ